MVISYIDTKIFRMSRENQHQLYIIPGIHGSAIFHGWAVDNWKIKGINPAILDAEWQSDEDFSTKLERVVDKVEVDLEEGKQVSLVGTSAGGVLALATLMEVPEIAHTVAVAVRLQTRDYPGYSTLDHFNKYSRSFVEGVRWIEQYEPYMPLSMREKVMTVTGSDDFHVPPKSAQLKGARNITLCGISQDHRTGIGQALTSHSKPIEVFLSLSRN